MPVRCLTSIYLIIYLYKLTRIQNLLIYMVDDLAYWYEWHSIVDRLFTTSFFELIYYVYPVDKSHQLKEINTQRSIGIYICIYMFCVLASINTPYLYRLPEYRHLALLS